MHLAIVTPYPPNVTGIGQYGYHVSRALAQSGAFERITLLTERLSPAGGRVEQPREISVERLWRPGSLASGWEIFQRLHALQPDLVWYNLGASVFGRSPLSNLSGLASPWLCRQDGFPTVVTLHENVEQADLSSLNAPGGRLAPLGARLLTCIATRADVVCVTLRRNARWLRGRWPSLRLVHIPVGSYNHPQLLPQSEGQELLIFTTFAPFKGLELLLGAYLDLQGRFPGLRLTVAGAEHPRYPGYLEQARRNFGEHAGVSWLGCLPEAELPSLFGRSAVVVLPYTATTGSSSVLYRAATWGRPLVCSDLPELRAVVAEGGLKAEFFASGDRSDLAQALARLLADPQRRQAHVYHNLNAVAKTTLPDTARAYLYAFELALAARHSRVRMSIPISRGQEAA